MILDVLGSQRCIAILGPARRVSYRDMHIAIRIAISTAMSQALCQRAMYRDTTSPHTINLLCKMQYPYLNY